jgi:hypothetical protein
MRNPAMKVVIRKRTSTKKIRRQERNSVNMPPSVTPVVKSMDTMEPKMPRARFRLLPSGKVVVIKDRRKEKAWRRQVPELLSK